MIQEMKLDPSVLNPAVEGIKGWVDDGTIVGAVLYVYHREELMFADAFGYSDREREIPMKCDNIVRMRSMTKPLVGTAVLMLMEEGELGLEDPIARFIPAFDNPEKREITIGQLLTHTSGLTGSIYSNAEGTTFSSLREAVDHVGREGPMDFAPGTAYHYSDPGSSTLGALVEEVSGMPSEDFIQRRILDPVGMKDSFCNLVDKDDPRRSRVGATYHGEPGQLEKYWDNTMPQKVPFFRASGGLYSTAEDYARFITAISRGGSSNGVRLLSPETVQLALADYTSHLLGPGDEARQERAYGLHWFIYHNVSAAAFGHGGSDGTIAWSDAERDLIGLYLTQSRGTATRQDLVARITRAVPKVRE